jgi:hypothetical protein
MKTFLLRINEPREFTGPNGRRVFPVQGAGAVFGPAKENWGNGYYLLDVETLFEMDGEPVQQLICSPRYQGDTLDMADYGECTVGVARVKPGVQFEAGQTIDDNEVVYCAIGVIGPAPKL